MPGIAGIIRKIPNEESKRDVLTMTDCMIHESFYNRGTYFNEKIGLYAGWVCHQGSFSDCMPLLNKEKNVILIFFGENFFDHKSINRLKKRDHDIQFNNASYLMSLYLEQGEKFLQDLNGWFCGILVDLRKNVIILFNDRYGMQRLYFHENKHSFYFSSEAKSLLKILPEVRELDMSCLAEYFLYGCVLDNRTLFRNIYLLPGASSWIFSRFKNKRKVTYFEPDRWERQPILTIENFYEKFKETFYKILPRYFASDRQIGMSITGGLDTRMILAAKVNGSKDIPFYTFGGLYRDSFDVCISRILANECNHKHITLILDNQFLANFQNYLEKSIFISDGCCGISGSYELYLNQLAKNIASIRMTGDFGSEILRGVSLFKGYPYSEKLFSSEFFNYIKAAENSLPNYSKEHKTTFALFKEIPWLMYGCLSIEQSQLTLRTPYMDNELVKLVYQAPASARSTDEISLRLIKDSNPILAKIRTDQGACGRSNFFLSQYAKLFAKASFKAEYFYNYGMPQWLAKIDHIFKPMHIERLFLGRHKFHHFRIWLRNELSDYIRDILLDRRTASRPYLDVQYLKKIVQAHTKGNRNYTTEISSVLSSELTQRLLIENI